MEIRLFVCQHTPGAVPEHPLLVPVQAGAAIAPRRFPGMLHDDAGAHISRKNRAYCELTVQYWAWKNVRADYYGFFHYRRYLYPDARARRPYILAQSPTPALLRRLGFDDFAPLIEQYDLLLPLGEEMYLPVREHYAQAPFHHARDLRLAEAIVLERNPEMERALEQYLSGTVCYFGNLYILRREVFFDYCAWLFPILETFDRRADLRGYSGQELRVDGYLAERLFGVWYTRHRSGLRTLELPRVHFGATGAQRLRYALLPPGTRRRARVKRMLRRMRGR